MSHDIVKSSFAYCAASKLSHLSPPHNYHKYFEYLLREMHYDIDVFSGV